ncbi:MAG: phasin family protein [Proteobacteria bacterium]|nr:phasin family protein [Pseudomonadota bacterium]
MLDLIRKSFEAALGGVSATQEKLKELADEFVVRGHLTKKEGSDLLKGLKATAKESQKKLGSSIEVQVRKVMKELGVATSSEVKALKGRIAKLEKDLGKEKKKAAPKRKATSSKKTAKDTK